MKNRYKILIILVPIVAYIGFVEIDNYFDGGLHEMPRNMMYSDAGLSPSHANNNLWHFLNSTLPIILFFTLPYIPLWLIEKYKKIPARSLQKLFLGSTAIYFGGSLSIILLIGIVNLIFNPSDHFGSFGTFIFTFGLLGIPVLALGIVLLYKSPILRSLLNR